MQALSADGGDRGGQLRSCCRDRGDGAEGVNADQKDLLVASVKGARDSVGPRQQPAGRRRGDVLCDSVAARLPARAAQHQNRHPRVRLHGPHGAPDGRRHKHLFDEALWVGPDAAVSAGPLHLERPHSAWHALRARYAQGCAGQLPHGHDRRRHWLHPARRTELLRQQRRLGSTVRPPRPRPSMLRGPGVDPSYDSLRLRRVGADRAGGAQRRALQVCLRWPHDSPTQALMPLCLKACQRCRPESPR
eukprot:05420_3